MVSIGMNPQHELDLAVQPSPVLMQAVVKVPLPTLMVSYMSSASMLVVRIQYKLSPSHIIAFSLEKCDAKASVLVDPQIINPTTVYGRMCRVTMTDNQENHLL